MPELPEVETVRLGLIPVLENRLLTRVLARRNDFRTKLPPDFATRLIGRRVIALERRAKYLIWRLDDGEAALVHLGMSGSMTIQKPPFPDLRKHDHLLFETEDRIRILYRDPRRFGSLALIRYDALLQTAPLSLLGPEPLENAFSGQGLHLKLAGKRQNIKAALLDQKNVAGLGNIYVCEALFRAGIHPFSEAGKLDLQALERLVSTIKSVLEEAIKAGGSSLKDHRQASGEMGYFQHAFQVYDREGQDCLVCKGKETIKRVTQNGRSTYYCALCQPVPEGLDF